VITPGLLGAALGAVAAGVEPDRFPVLLLPPTAEATIPMTIRSTGTPMRTAAQRFQ